MTELQHYVLFCFIQFILYVLLCSKDVPLKIMQDQFYEFLQGAGLGGLAVPF